MPNKQLRFRDIMDFMLDDAGLGGLAKNVRSNFQSCHKSDNIVDFITTEGMPALRVWLEKAYMFITKERLLERKTFQELIDQVNSDDNGRLEDVTVGNFMTAADGIVMEFIDGHANPLYCKDELYQIGRNIMMKKNHDYRGGSGDPYANFRGSVQLGISPIQGILLRVQDKIMRIKTFDEAGKLEVENEGIVDAIVDVQNYMDLIYGLVKEQSRESE